MPAWSDKHQQLAVANAGTVPSHLTRSERDREFGMEKAEMFMVDFRLPTTAMGMGTAVVTAIACGTVTAGGGTEKLDSDSGSTGNSVDW